MIIELLHYNFKLLANKVDSLANKDFDSAEIDEYLNQAIQIFVNTTYAGYNQFRAEVDDTPYITQNLTTLVSLPETISPSLISNGIYYFNLDALSNSFQYYLNAKVLANGCVNIPVIIISHDELESALRNGNLKPSLKWRRVLGVFGSNGNSRVLRIYTNAEFSVSSLTINYIKAPNEVSIGGYNGVNNVLKPKVECNLPDSIHHRIVEKAVQIAQGVLENSSGYQIATNNVNSNI